MSRVEKQIEVNVPAEVAYDQWTQFESFPSFMDGVKRVVQTGDKTLNWSAMVGGKLEEWTAEIVDQMPNERIAWRSTGGAQNEGAVLFESRGPARTLVTLIIEAQPDGLVEHIGDAAGFLDRQVQGDLEHFKAFIEARRVPTGAWHGEIHGKQVIRS